VILRTDTQVCPYRKIFLKNPNGGDIYFKIILFFKSAFRRRSSGTRRRKCVPPPESRVLGSTRGPGVFLPVLGGSHFTFYTLHFTLIRIVFTFHYLPYIFMV
jgi:hypothetical protein